MYDYVGEIIHVLAEAGLEEARIALWVGSADSVEVEVNTSDTAHYFEIRRLEDGEQEIYKVFEGNCGSPCCGQFASAAQAAEFVINQVRVDICDVCGDECLEEEFTECDCGDIVCPDCVVEDAWGVTACRECLELGYWHFSNGHLRRTSHELLYSPPPRSAK